MLSKKLFWIFMVAILLISLAGCVGLKTAQLEITFDPNPVPCENEHLSWKTIISEINGVGVTLETIVQDVYVGDEKVASHTYDEVWMEEWLGSSYIPAFSSMTITAGCGCMVTHEIFTVNGIDNNGHEVQATGRVDAL